MHSKLCIAEFVSSTRYKCSSLGSRHDFLCKKPRSSNKVYWQKRFCNVQTRVIVVRNLSLKHEKLQLDKL